MEALGLDPARRTILITGGSQGARGLNQKVLASLRQLDAIPNSDIQVLWATGHNHQAEVEGELQSLPMQWIRVHAVPFIDRMDQALVAADGAVARAGASTVAELLSAGVFPWLIPFPYAIHNHQVVNARVVVDQQAGWMTEERDLTPEVMTDHLRRMMDRVRSLPLGARKLPPANLDSTHAAERLAILVLGQLGWKGPVPSISSASQ
jgi:UDP-N-acetylglucosamine--N-acetylmuramyl-(pentapeptide) pyrophosphoryl-undecaprenol N-acetylglucosamine transferase